MTGTSDRRSSPGIGIRALSKTFGGFAALDRVDLDIRPGEFMTLLGPSGSGKSTLLMAIAGFTHPSAGDIRFDGASMVATAPHRRNIGMVFQRHALFPHMSVFENIAYPLRLRRVPRPEVARRVAEVLAMVQLQGFEGRRVDELSGGQSQRVAVARAIVFSPGILLMDEPLSALDKNLREQLQLEIRALHDKLGLTTVYVTHDQREALVMSDRIAVMNRGRIAQVDAPRALFERPADAFVARFIGETTLVPVLSEAGTPTVLGAAIPAGRLPGGDRRYLVLRPGMVEICPPGDATPGYLRFQGTRARPIFEGESVLHQIVCPGGHTVQSRDPAPGRDDRGGIAGEPVTLRIALDRLHFVPEAPQ
jgi:putative spermidine/putrescine transport system ATP-binding protein